MITTNKKDLLKDIIHIIEKIRSYDYDVNLFIRENYTYFSDIPVKSLLKYSYIRTGITDESTYIFLIGSYMFYRFIGNPLTWLYRRRFADFPFNDEWNLFLKKTITYDTEKYTSIREVKEYILAELDK